MGSWYAPVASLEGSELRTPFFVGGLQGFQIRGPYYETIGFTWTYVGPAALCPCFGPCYVIIEPAQPQGYLAQAFP